MTTSAEKLVKQTIKTIAKKHDLDYSELKTENKKIVKMAKMFDQELLGMMEELLDLPDCSSEEELADFNIEVLKIYCRIKDLDDTGSDKSIRARVLENLEEDDSDYDSEEESEEESEYEEPESEPEPVIIKKKKEKKESE
jgi:hypothetical protein